MLKLASILHHLKIYLGLSVVAARRKLLHESLGVHGRHARGRIQHRRGVVVRIDYLQRSQLLITVLRSDPFLLVCHE